MLITIYTLAAIANIIANSNNYHIDHKLNPNLRVRKSIGDTIQPAESHRQWSDVNNDNNAVIPDSVERRDKRSYYIAVERVLTTTTPDVTTTELYDPKTTTTTTTPNSLYDYENDYENGGNFIYKTPTVVMNTTENNNTDSAFNDTVKNNTQAYHPLSHTFIPGYNQPQDVLTFEKGPVSDTSEPDKEQSVEEQSSENERDKRSYYIPIPGGKPGGGQAYYPLSHTYIPGYNTQGDVFNFERGEVLPTPKNNTTNVKNDPKRHKDDSASETTSKRTTTKRPTTKHNADRITRSTKATIQINDDYVDYTRPTNQRPVNRYHQTTTKRYQPVSESLDYDNYGDFIVYPQRPAHRDRPKQTRPQPGKHPKDTEDDSDEMYDTHKKSSSRKHAVARYKRSYYTPIYEYDQNGRKMINGYRPLSHTYIPGYNEQDDVWRFEGGPVYPDKSVDTDNTHNGNTPTIKPDKHKKQENRDNKAKTKKDKHESLLDKIVNPIKKLFGYRKRRSIDNANAKVIQKRNGVTDFVNNVVGRINNYTRRDQIVVIDENNIYNRKTNENNANSVPDPNSYGYEGRDYRANPNGQKYDNGQYHPNENKPYDYNKYKTSNDDHVDNMLNDKTIDTNTISLSPQHIGTNIDEENGTEENLAADETIIACIMCKYTGCPNNYKRFGQRCIRFG